jgi:hypothetical protein
MSTVVTTRVRKTVRTATGRTRAVTSSLGAGTAHARQRIDDLIATVGGWRGERLAELRALIHEVDPGVVEDWKWMGTPVWSHDGMYVLANAHKGKVKLQFFHGAQLPDPKQLFNAGLEGGTWRAIDFFEGDSIDRPALKALLRAAVKYNTTHVVPMSTGSRP